MIKKIDANEYGVVRYAITSVDELNRLPKKIAPSSQAILIENGLRVFVYGDGQWVEEVVDGDLSENMQSIVADYERSKIGYDGVKRGSLGERLKDDFQGIYDILNARDYCEYSGKELKVDNTWMGNQIDTRVEGRTLQNVADVRNDGIPKPQYATAIRSNLLKPNTTYTLVAFNNSDEDLVLYWNNKSSFAWKEITIKAKSYIVDKNYVNGQVGIEPNGYSICLSVQTETTVPMDLKAILLEGDYTQTPLSELPYFEGIESVGERDIGKNLCDNIWESGRYTISEGIPFDDSEAIRTVNFINCKPSTTYTITTYNGDNLYNVNEYNNGVFVKATQGSIDNSATRTITTSETTNQINISMKVWTENTVIQFEEGTQATPYEPFGYVIKGKSCGKNLFDKNNAEIVPWYIAQGESNNKFVKAVTLRGFTFKSKFNTNYVITKSYEIENNCFRVYGSKEYPKLNGIGEHLAHKDGQGQISFNSGENKYITCMCYTIKTDENTELEEILKVFDTIQVEEGVDTIGYEPYQESTYSIHSPIPLRSLPNGVCDVYDFESGAVIQKVGKIVLDGSRDWARNLETDIVIEFNSNFNLAKGSPSSNLYCDNFIPSSKFSLRKIAVNEDNIYIALNKSELPSVDVQGLKNWLHANPTTVYYELREPIIHYLTPSQLKSFDGTTHVISENTLIPTTTTKILTDTYANVSNVNSTAYSLRRGVNNVAETSAMINETDVEQDDVLDVTMCAIDELYSMLEPNLE
jgi:hypothetical protein